MTGNTRKSIQTVAIISLAAAVFVVGWLVKDRIDLLEARVAKLEDESRVLSPLVTVMAASRPGPGIPSPYEPVQATGPADVPAPGDTDSRAWCPAVENAGIEWLELEYAQPVTAAVVRIHATNNPGAVVRVQIGDGSGAMRELPVEPDASTHIQTIPVSPPMEISRVKLELDTSIAPGWNEIDAVALIDETGEPHWAVSATASSHWKFSAE